MLVPPSRSVTPSQPAVSIERQALDASCGERRKRASGVGSREERYLPFIDASWQVIRTTRSGRIGSM